MISPKHKLYHYPALVFEVGFYFNRLVDLYRPVDGVQLVYSKRSVFSYEMLMLALDTFSYNINQRKLSEASRWV